MPLFGVGYVAAYRPINSLPPPPPSFTICFTLRSMGDGGHGSLCPLYIGMPVEWQWCSQDVSSKWGQSDRACVCVCGGGGGVSPSPMVGRFVLIMCIQVALFGTLKDLLDSPINGGRLHGPLYSLSYASDSGVAMICQRGAKWRSKVTKQGRVWLSPSHGREILKCVYQKSIFCCT